MGLHAVVLLALVNLTLACGPQPGGGADGSTGGATSSGTSTGAAPTSPSSSDGSTTPTPTTGAATTGPVTSTGDSSAGSVTSTGASATGEPTSTTPATSNGDSSSTGTPPDVCDAEPLTDLPQHACAAFTDVDSCLAADCTWWLHNRRYTAEDCACAQHPAGGFCVWTPDHAQGGSQVESAIFRVVDGAPEVMVLDHLPFAVPPGWAECAADTPPALCDCACPVWHCM